MYKRNETIKNTAVLNFDLCGRSYAIASNEVEAKVVKLRIIKEEDKNIVFAGDKICYKITIYNDSCFNLCDLDFRDSLSDEICYERESFRVNGEKKYAELRGRTVCYHINELKEKEELVITFEAKVE